MGKNNHFLEPCWMFALYFSTVAALLCRHTQNYFFLPSCLRQYSNSIENKMLLFGGATNPLQFKNPTLLQFLDSILISILFQTCTCPISPNAIHKKKDKNIQDWIRKWMRMDFPPDSRCLSGKLKKKTKIPTLPHISRINMHMLLLGFS